MPDDTVERRFIVPGPQRRGKTVVTSGLVAGERIITEGMHRIKHGQRIIPLTEEEYSNRLAQEEKERLIAEQRPVEG